MAALAIPTTSEAATPATGDGFESLSTTMKDNFDDLLQRHLSKIN